MLRLLYRIKERCVLDILEKGEDGDDVIRLLNDWMKGHCCTLTTHVVAGLVLKSWILIVILLVIEVWEWGINKRVIPTDSFWGFKKRIWVATNYRGLCRLGPGPSPFFGTLGASRVSFWGQSESEYDCCSNLIGQLQLTYHKLSRF